MFAPYHGVSSSSSSSSKSARSGSGDRVAHLPASRRPTSARVQPLREVNAPHRPRPPSAPAQSRARMSAQLPHPPASMRPGSAASQSSRPGSARRADSPSGGNYKSRFAAHDAMMASLRASQQAKKEQAETARAEEAKRNPRAAAVAAAAAAAAKLAEPEPEPEPLPPGSMRTRMAANAGLVGELTQMKMHPQKFVSNNTWDTVQANLWRLVAHDKAGKNWAKQNQQATRRRATPGGYTTTAARTKPQVSRRPTTASTQRQGLKSTFEDVQAFYKVGEAGRVLSTVDPHYRKTIPHMPWVEEVDKQAAAMPPWASPKGRGATQYESRNDRQKRLRAMIQESRKEKDSSTAAAHAGLSLHSTEHASIGLQMRLARGQEQDENRMARALKHVRPSVDSTGASVGVQHVAECIAPLCELAESKYAEIQRDVAAALHSLSINEENKVAFLEAAALPTLIAMAAHKDVDIRRNVAGAMYRLSCSPKLKRPMVKAQILPSLLEFCATGHREVQRFAMYAVKELCEDRHNRTEIIAAGALPALYEHCNSNDNRIAREAIWTLNALADDENDRLSMLESGALQVSP